MSVRIGKITAVSVCIGAQAAAVYFGLVVELQRQLFALPDDRHGSRRGLRESAVSENRESGRLFDLYGPAADVRTVALRGDKAVRPGAHEGVDYIRSGAVIDSARITDIFRAGCGREPSVVFFVIPARQQFHHQHDIQPSGHHLTGGSGIRNRRLFPEKIITVAAVRVHIDGIRILSLCGKAAYRARFSAGGVESRHQKRGQDCDNGNRD